MNAWVLPGISKAWYKEPNYKSSANKIKDVVCDEFGVPFHYVLNRRRHADVLIVKQVLSFFLYYYSKMPYKGIGEYLCPHRPYDHSTVLHNVSCVQKFLEVEEDLESRLLQIHAKLIKLES
jgi:chromosomal replication initiation ATPase DnaA